MRNKKGQTSTDTPIIIWLIAFQIFIITTLGFIDIKPETTTYTEPISGFSIINIINSITYLPLWANTILFSPLIGAVVYIVAKLVRGGG